MKSFKSILILIFLLSVCSMAFAGSNVYKDDYTTEDSTGHWTFTSFKTGKQLENVSIISQTPATLTTASSGKTFIVDGGGAGATGATICSFTLPTATASTAQMYKFISGDGSGIVVRTSDVNHTDLYTDTILFGLAGDNAGGTGVEKSPATNTSLRLIRKAAGNTGATITVRNNVNGYWYVEVSSAYATGSTVVYEARTGNQKIGG